MTTTFDTRIKQLRNEMAKQKVHGVIIPSTDEFQNEIVPPHARRLEFISGFTGSYGLAIILHDQAILFTDGRYTLQAAKEVPTHIFQIKNIAEQRPWSWAGDNLGDEQLLAFDPKIHTHANVLNYYNANCTIFPTSYNLIDRIWDHKPQPKTNAVVTHPLSFSGARSNEKIADIATDLSKNNLDACIVTNCSSICWLLNIRSQDVPNTPLALATAIIHSNAKVELFVEPTRLNEDVKAHLGKNVIVHPPHKLESHLLSLKNINIQIDPNESAYWFFQSCKHLKVTKGEDPCALPKACKNKTEINGTKHAHFKDGIALTKALHWIDKHAIANELSEWEISEKLIEFRKTRENFVEPSFDSIVGFKENGAVVHYRPTEDNSKKINSDGILLIDSGGQYLEGTTDVTRTLAIGTPTNEQKHQNTLVLKGHIALATTIFPYGTTGSNIDSLARQFLWQDGLDYDHGTGHGVGSYLSVHEGPQRISKVANNVTLEPGMILSNEPGFYQEGSHGFRVENLVIVTAFPKLSTNERQFLGFKTITMAPLDYKLIDFSLLNDGEIDWLTQYHDYLVEVFAEHLTNDELEWLKETTTIPNESKKQRQSKKVW